jgi:hypothetical protein
MGRMGINSPSTSAGRSTSDDRTLTDRLRGGCDPLFFPKSPWLLWLLFYTYGLFFLLLLPSIDRASSSLLRVEVSITFLEVERGERGSIEGRLFRTLLEISAWFSLRRYRAYCRRVRRLVRPRVHQFDWIPLFASSTDHPAASQLFRSCSFICSSTKRRYERRISLPAVVRGLTSLGKKSNPELLSSLYIGSCSIAHLNETHP